MCFKGKHGENINKKRAHGEGLGNGHVHTAIFKMDNRQGLTVCHMELCSMLCVSLDGTGVWGAMDTCICMAESLCCLPETITMLFVNQLSPQYNLKSLKKTTQGIKENICK